MTTMTDADAMLRAVLLDPADDVARLVYADALEEAGDRERAEFVRLQVEIAQFMAVRDGNHLESRALLNWRDRERRLLFANEYRNAVRWLDYPGFYMLDACDTRGERRLKMCTQEKPGDGRTVFDVVLSRGFISRIELPCPAFLRDGFAKELFSRHPVTSVVLVDKEPTRGGGDYVFFCRDDRGDGTTDPWGLPPALYDRLARPFARDPRYGCTRASAYYYRAEDGQADLSAACVAYGRAAAGLPPLPGGAA